jgi:hypothetical protein
VDAVILLFKESYHQTLQNALVWGSTHSAIQPVIHTKWMYDCSWKGNAKCICSYAYHSQKSN